MLTPISSIAAYNELTLDAEGELVRRVFLGLGLWFMVCSSGFAASAADESKILALENAWNQAQIHHDGAALDQLLPATFVNTDYDGTVMNKAQFLADLKDPAYQASLVVNQDVKIYSYSDAAVVTGTYHTKGKYKGKPFRALGTLYRHVVISGWHLAVCC